MLYETKLSVYHDHMKRFGKTLTGRFTRSDLHMKYVIIVKKRRISTMNILYINNIAAMQAALAGSSDDQCGSATCV